VVESRTPVLPRSPRPSPRAARARPARTAQGDRRQEARRAVPRPPGSCSGRRSGQALARMAPGARDHPLRQVARATWNRLYLPGRAKRDFRLGSRPSDDALACGRAESALPRRGWTSLWTRCAGPS